jgi:hypothetical protein
VDEPEFQRRVATEVYRIFCPERMGEGDFIDLNYPVREVRKKRDAIVRTRILASHR